MSKDYQIEINTHKFGMLKNYIPLPSNRNLNSKLNVIKKSKAFELKESDIIFNQNERSINKKRKQVNKILLQNQLK